MAGRTFDLLILNNVLEHILSLKDSIAWCLAFLPAGGRLYIEVPDLAQFDDTPDLYQQFSAEHVNYFTLQTLRALMQRMGMQIDRVVQHHGNICSLWQREAFDTKGKQRLEAYLAKADALGHRLCEKLRAIPAGTPVYLWAAGTHTAMLSQLGAFRHLKLKGVIDTNRNYSGHPAYGTKIIHPDDLHLAGETIIVSSQGAQQEIEILIKERYGEDAKVVLLYERS